VSFSPSPLVPDAPQASGEELWSSAAQLVLAAAEQSVAQVPSAVPLAVGTPQRTDGAVLPEPAGAAVTAYIGGGVEGKVLLVVGTEFVEALAGTPFGEVEPAQALRPALDALATALGGRIEGDPTGLEVENCLEVLTGGTAVLVPLTARDAAADETASAPVVLLGVSLATPPPGVEAAGPAAGQSSVADAAKNGQGSWSIDLLRDVEMEVTCELGRTRMTVRQLLALAPGDVVELDRLAGAPADLLVNGTLLARGEVVVVDESFGLRITEIVAQDAP